MESRNNKFLVKYENSIYDLSAFALKHPGGINTLKGLEGTDMTTRFKNGPPHSNAAMYLMNEYKVEQLPANQNNNCEDSTNVTDSPKITNGQLHNIKDNFEKPQNSEGNKDFLNNNIQTPTDDSMEHIVDWSKAMIPQIHKITEYYNEWVNKPVDRPLRLFGPWYLEMCTKTPWWVIPIFWIPIIVHLVILEASVETHLKSSVIAQYFGSGIILWTLLEYSLHRWIFHMNTTKKQPWFNTFHFLIHGLHHKVPFDPYRLVFPPAAAVILTSIIYIIIYPFFAYPKITVAGGLLGYVCYDLIHYYLHYGNPSMRHLYQMKRYHYQHHFVHHDLGFGISSPLWDFVFGTQIFLRKLKYILEWKH